MNSAQKSATQHQWRFFRSGGFDQVRLDRGADLAHLRELDQKLWVALACPVTGLEFEPRTLELIDTDKDGRIRVPELLAAAEWTCGLLKDPDLLVGGTEHVPLSAINDSGPEGQRILASARRVLAQLGKPEAESISVADTSDTAKILAQTKFNGDGVVVPESTEDAAVAGVIQNIMDCLGGEPDRSGKAGVTAAKVDQFFAEAEAYSGWMKRGETEAEAVLPLENATAAAVSAMQAVRSKVKDYFARCRLASFDSRAAAALNREEKEFLALAVKDLTLETAEIAALPLARVEAGRALPLSEGLNPAWAGAVEALREKAVKPLLGERKVLTETEWQTLLSRLAPFEAWQGAKAGAGVEKLGLARVREILSGKSREAIAALIAQDLALEPEFAGMASVDKLVRLTGGLQRLCLNFVNFKDFYAPGREAIFQAGTLYLDQRACRLCLPVADAGKHAALAGLAGAYLAYCDCTRPGSSEKRQIVAAFTNGDSDQLMVGRNGVFYDRKGRDWDATITKLVENPISLRQAFWLPYKKFVRMIEELVAKRAAAAEAQSTAKMQSAATAVASADKTAAPKPGEPAKKVDVGTVAAIGVAFGAIGAFVTALWGHLIGVITLGPLAILGALAGVILLISVPSMLIAWLKLRKRSLGPILDANGWAVNSRARINGPFGASLTSLAALPAGAQRELRDPYAEKRSPWPRLIAFAVVLWIAYSILNTLGYIHEWSGGRFGKEKARAETAQSAPDTTDPATNAPAAQ